MKRLSFLGFLFLTCAAFAAPSGIEYVRKVAKLTLSDTEGISISLPANVVAAAPKNLKWPEEPSPFYGAAGSDRAALFRAVGAHHAEDTPRAAVADYVEENGDPEMGEFIRLQLSYAQYAAKFPRLIAGHSYADFPSIAQRMVALLEEHHADWFYPFYRAILENGEALSATKMVRDFPEFNAQGDEYSDEEISEISSAARHALRNTPISVRRFEVRRGFIDMVAPRVPEVNLPDVSEYLLGDAEVLAFYQNALLGWWLSLQPEYSVPIAGIETEVPTSEFLYDRIAPSSSIRRLRLHMPCSPLASPWSRYRHRGRGWRPYPTLEHLELFAEFDDDSITTGFSRTVEAVLNAVQKASIKLRSLRLKGPLMMPTGVFGTVRESRIDTSNLILVDLSESDIGDVAVSNAMMDHPFFENVSTLLLDGTSISIDGLEGLGLSATHRKVNALGLSGTGYRDPSQALATLAEHFPGTDGESHFGYVNVAPRLNDRAPKGHEPGRPAQLPNECAQALVDGGTHLIR